MYMCADAASVSVGNPAVLERVNSQALNVSLVNELRRYSSYVSRANFLGEVLVVQFTTEPKKHAEMLKIDIARKLSEVLDMEFQFFRGVAREWWFRRA